MPELDTYDFVAMPISERMAIVSQQVEQLERVFFEAQLAWSIRKSELDITSEAGKTEAQNFKDSVKVQKNRLAAARRVLDELKGAQAKVAEAEEAERAANATVDDPANVSVPEAAKSTKAGKKK